MKLRSAGLEQPEEPFVINGAAACTDCLRSQNWLKLDLRCLTYEGLQRAYSVEKLSSLLERARSAE
jgi:hypothetical protein